MQQMVIGWRGGIVIAIALAACGDNREGALDPMLDSASADAMNEPARFTSFRFEKQLNPSLANDVSATIINGALRINLPEGTNPSALIASFEINRGEVFVGDVSQVSGETANDFRKPVAYRIVDGPLAIPQMVGVALPSHSFGPATTLEGLRPLGIAIGDLDNDDRPDLVTAELNGRGLAIYRSTTDLEATTATFESRVSLPSPNDNGADSVVLADLDNDGRLDLAAVYGGNLLGIRLNTTSGGAPQFTNNESFSTESIPVSLVAADLDADDRTDIAVANAGSDTVSVFLNETASNDSVPSFAAPIALPADDTPVDIVSGDIDGDGRLDLVVANGDLGKVSVLINSTIAGAAAPSFADAVTFEVEGFARGVSVADFNGDDKQDIAVGNNGRDSVTVFLNVTPAGASTPIFDAGTAFETEFCPISTSAADINADGLPDLVVVDNCLHLVAVLINITAVGASTPEFMARVELATGPDPTYVTVGDLNGDTRPDLAVASSGNGTDLGGPTVLLGLPPQ